MVSPGDENAILIPWQPQPAGARSHLHPPLWSYSEHALTSAVVQLAITERDQRLLALQDRWDRVTIEKRAAIETGQEQENVAITGNISSKSIALSKVMSLQELEALQTKMEAAMEAEKQGKVVEGASE